MAMRHTFKIEILAPDDMTSLEVEGRVKRVLEAVQVELGVNPIFLQITHLAKQRYKPKEDAR